jgi:outer membrane protein assembly factor BamB
MVRRAAITRAALTATVTMAGGALVAAAAIAQTTSVERPATVVVGLPAGGARTDRVDGARTGRSRDTLPTGSLHTEWREPTGATLEHEPIVDARGTTYVVGTRGEVVAIARDGTEKWRASTSAMQPGAAALLANETLVFVAGSGEAVGVRDGALAWRTRFGRQDQVHPAPLPLEDGGVVVATSHEIAELDADGRERSRVTLGEREAIAAPLVSALGRVVAVTVNGTVWAWTPGTTEPTRIGSFGSAVDGAAALADDHTLVAVTGGQLHLEAIDLARGTTTTRAIAPAGLFLGPPAMRGSVAMLGLLAPTSELLITFDGAGGELSRTPLATHPPPVAADGGAGVLVAASHTPPLVDSAGTYAFATTDGKVGVVPAGGAVEMLADACSASAGVLASVNRTPAPASGIAPLGTGAFVVTCHSGSVLAVRGGGGAGEERPQHLK